jgi:hypothetical protein
MWLLMSVCCCDQNSVRSLGGFLRTSLSREVALILMNTHHRHASDILNKLIHKIAILWYILRTVYHSCYDNICLCL